MGVGILAPVPAVHLKSALETCAMAGRVAFGSEAWDLFHKVSNEYGEGLPILIYATHYHGAPDKLCTPGYAGFRGLCVGITMAKAGKHPDPSLRPRTTIEGPSPDTNWSMFWEVSDLVQLGKQDRIAITNLTAVGQKKPFANGFVPHGPMLVKAASL